MSLKTDVDRAVAALGMPVSKYAITRVLPMVAASVVAAITLTSLTPGVFSGWLLVVPLAIPVVAFAALVLHPLQAMQRRRHVMDHQMHYFISHLGVLATSSVPPVELFAHLGEKKHEYGPLAEDCEKVATLVTRWNMSLAEACRFTAKRTASVIFSDFLERFAFGVESGADLEPYLAAEQEVVMADYDTLYKSTLYKVEAINQMYNSLMMTIIFLAILAMLMPVLVGGSAALILFGVLGAVGLVQGIFLLITHLQVPPDPVWADPTGALSPLRKSLRIVLPVTVVCSAALAPALLLWTRIPDLIAVAMAGTPLLVPGLVASREEGLLKRRDDNYPAYMRSLGASTSARGGDARDVLRHLRWHDFGPLTENIRDLFKRLQLRMDDETAWRYFTTEAGSTLIERFTRMYEEAIDTGGRPADVGRIISDNMVRILGLRKLRYQTAGSLRGTLVGIAAATGFSLFVGLGVLNMLTGMFNNVMTDLDDAPIDIPTIIHTSAIDLNFLTIIVIVLLIVNSAMSSVMIRIVDGGAKTRALSDFTFMLWVSNVVAYLSSLILRGVAEGPL